MKQYGLRTRNDISKGTMILEYLGEIIDIREFQKRVVSYDLEGANYQLVVREHFPGPGLTLTHVIDATRIGNAARFINHACEPNLEVQPLRVESTIPHFGLFAVRNIVAGEELSISYGPSSFPDEIKASSSSTPMMEKSSTSSRNGLQLRKCHCGSIRCRGYLPFDQELLPKDKFSNKT